MKVVAFNGSPRKEGNTSILINMVLQELMKEGIETELVQLGSNSIRGCMACGKCFENRDQKCVISGDVFNSCFDKMIEADAVIIGSPTYVSNVTAEVKALIDRACMVNSANGHILKRKAGAAVVAVRRAGALHTFNSINHFFFISQMIVPGSSYWNLGMGLLPGDVNDDDEGKRTMENLGKNMAWLLKELYK